MFKKPTVISLILSSVLTLSISAGAISLQSLELAPESLSSDQIQHRGPHRVAWRQDVISDHLLVTLGGTNSRPHDMAAISEVAVQLGYQTIGLDYNNSVISTTCSTSSDDDCFDLFRQAVSEGKPGSQFLSINKENSLESRLKSVLISLVAQDPQSWARFYNSESRQIAWQKIVVIGHSQGSGHAAYLAKKHPLKAAILLAGPQDRFKDSSQQVAWLKADSQTPRHKYLALTHEKDFFNSQFQLEGLAILRDEVGQMAVTTVGLEAPLESGHSILVSNAEVRDGHMAVIGKPYAEIWRYLLIEAAR